MRLGIVEGHDKGLLDLGKGQDVADNRSHVNAPLDDPVERGSVVAVGAGADRENQAQLLAQHVQYSDRHQALDIVLVRDAKADHLGVAAAEGRHEAERLGDAHGLDREAAIAPPVISATAATGSWDAEQIACVAPI